jgi:hypothetical protein
VFVERLGVALEIKVVKMRNHCLQSKNANSERNQRY